MSRPIKEIVAEMRVRANLTTEELAEATRLPAAVLERFEVEGRGLSIADVERISDYFQVDAATLLRGELDPTASLRLFFNKRGAYDFYADDEALITQALQRAKVLCELHRLTNRGQDLRQHFVPEPPGKTPYEDGYQLARQVRERLENLDRRLEALDTLIEERFGVLIDEATLRHESIQAVSAKTQSGAAMILLNRSNAGYPNPCWRRGNLAHELGHILRDPPEDGFNQLVVDQDSALAWWSSSPGEQRAKAFAAELLIPTAGLERLLPTFPATQEATALVRIADVREEFQTTFEVTLYHLVNQGYIAKSLKERLQKQWRGAPEPWVSDATPPRPLWQRVQQAYEQQLITEQRARELLGLSLWDPLPWRVGA